MSIARSFLIATALAVLSGSTGCALVRGVEIGAGGHAAVSGPISGFAPSLTANLLLFGGNGWGGGVGGSAVMHDGDAERTLAAGANINFLHDFGSDVLWHNSALVGWTALKAKARGVDNSSFGVGFYTGIAYHVSDSFIVSVGPDLHMGFNPYAAIGVQGRITFYPNGGCMCGSH